MTENGARQNVEQDQVASELRRWNLLLDAINQVFQQALTCDSETDVARVCLAVAERLTGSAFGFLGEVNEQGHFDMIALSDPGWDSCRIPETQAAVLLRDMEIRGIWSKPILQEESVIVNDPDSEPNRVGVPAGHPALTCFLGVPLEQAGRTVGLIALANRQGGYDESHRADIEALAGAFVEVLYRKRAERELTDAEASYRGIFDSANDMIVVHDSETGRPLDVNERVVEAFGWTREEYLRLDVEDWSHGKAPYSQKEALERIRKAANGDPQLFEWLCKDKKGRRFWVEVNLRLASIAGRNRVLAIVRDVTERKRVENELRKHRDHLEQRVKERVKELNCLYRISQIVAQPDVSLEEIVREVVEAIPAGWKYPQLCCARVVLGGQQFRTKNFTSTDWGQSADIDVHGTHTGTVDVCYLEAKPELDEGPFLKEERHLIDAIASRLGKTVEQRRAEDALRRSRAELARSNADLEQFAYVASHDLQEPLRMVASYVQLLAKRYQGKFDSDADEFIAFAVDGATRMQRMIDDLLSYSRVGTKGKTFSPVDCNGVADEVIQNLQAAITEHEAAVTRDELPTVAGDRSQLVRLLQNLVGNAIKFHGDQPPQIHMSADRSDRQWVFSVQDNGIGIEPQYRERIFLIFQRLHTRTEYPGTGIGLAICKRIVDRHGGRIWLESEAGNGSTFYFTLPETGLPV